MVETPEDNDAQRIPPKLTITPRSEAGAEARNGDEDGAKPVVPKTVRMSPPLGTPPSELSTKKKTSRISLDDAVPKASEAPKTIRIKPAAAPMSPLKMPESRPATDDNIDMDASAAKRKTSRISLDSVLGGGEEFGSEGPKTIRLKRPSEAATVRLGHSAPAEAPVASSPTPTTAPIPSAVAEEATAETEIPSRRKTVRVKRPAGGGRIKSSAVSEAKGTSDADVDGAPVEESDAKAVEDRPHWFFLVSEIAAVLVACVTIYVFSSQAFGPNASMTELSYGAPDMYLSWPGRISPPR